MSVAVAATASLGHPLTSSKIAFYSTLAVVITFVVGAIVFNLRTESNLRPGNRHDRQAFTYPIVLLVASETFALGALYYGLDNGDIALWTAVLTTLGTTMFFSFLAVRIVDPDANIFDKPTGKFGGRVTLFTLMFVLAIVVPEIVMTTLSR